MSTEKAQIDTMHSTIKGDSDLNEKSALVQPPTLESTKTTPTSGKKLRKIVKPEQSKLKPLWLAGHLMTLGFGFLFLMYYVQRRSRTSWIPLLSYKLVLVGVWLSYTISIKSQYNIKSLPHYSALIATENFQYLLLSIFWFFNRNSFYKILPFLIISLLQLSSHFKLNGILKHEKKLLSVFLYDELFLFLVLIVDTLLMRGTSGFGLIAYSLFMWLRILQSENTRFFLYANLIKLDTLFLKIKNPKVQSAWGAMKNFLSYKQANFEQKFL